AAVPDSPTADWVPVSMSIGMTTLAATARTTNASQPAIAARRCCALQRPARAAKLVAGAVGCSLEVVSCDLRMERVVGMWSRPSFILGGSICERTVLGVHGLVVILSDEIHGDTPG